MTFTRIGIGHLLYFLLSDVFYVEFKFFHSKMHIYFVQNLRHNSYKTAWKVSYKESLVISVLFTIEINSQNSIALENMYIHTLYSICILYIVNKHTRASTSFVFRSFYAIFNRNNEKCLRLFCLK